MESKNQDIVNAFFKAYSERNWQALRSVMTEDVKWYFQGNHPYAGIKNGVEEIVAFFDTMAKIMGDGKPNITKLIVSENENHLIECIHSVSNRKDGNNLDHMACVLWTFKDGKILEGRHFFSDPAKVDAYFSKIVV